MTSQLDNPNATQVIVIGAGYAGMMATNRLLGSLTADERTRIAVTVVNDRNVFVERVRLHQLAAGSRASVATPLAAVLHPDVSTVIGRATAIDPARRRVRVVAKGRDLDLAYDYLVYAVGSEAAAPIPGARQNSYLIGDYESALALAGAIKLSGDRPRISVIGGGFTGVEVAAELADQHPDAAITLFCSGQLVGGMRTSARRTILKRLKRLGVSVAENSAVANIEPEEIRLANGDEIPFDVCILAASFDVPALAAVSGLAVDAAGRLRVDQHLRSIDDPSVIGAGDAVVAPDDVAAHLRMGCAIALPLGGHAAQTLLAAIRGTEPPVLSVGFAVQCLSLGRKNAYIQVVRSDDRPRALHVGGRAGARIKEMICAMVVDSPRKESSKPGSYSWPRGPKRMSNV